MHRHGYTLIELLAVVVVLGLAAGIGIPPLVRLVGGSPLDRASHAVRAGDLQARQLARGTGLNLDLLDDGVASRTTTPEHRVVMEPGSSVAWSTPDGKPLRTLTIDSRGRSIDLLVEVRVGRDRRRYLVSGISGEWSEFLSQKTTIPQASP